MDNICIDLSPWDDEKCFKQFKAEHDAIKGAKASKVMLGSNVSRKLLESLAAPGPRSSVKRMLQFSPTTPSTEILLDINEMCDSRIEETNEFEWELYKTWYIE